MTTPEEQASPEAPEQQRLTAVHAFTVGAIGMNGWINSEGAREDVAMDFWHLKQGDDRPHTDSIDWRRNLAAMRIMQTLAYSTYNSLPIIVVSEITEAEELYTSADEIIEETGLNRIPKFDVSVLGQPIRCFLKDATPKTNIDAILQQARRNRGAVQAEVIDIADLADAVENAPEAETLEDLQISPSGMLIEVHKFPDTPISVVEAPFYQQYVSASGGAEVYLRTFLEDIKWVSDQFGLSK